ncbi:hypothetical protein JB92DRAFT_516698 [Gautieria morchelliformis]|nr:hypothetical protein JB92DRAFT_516698 [Gautieria morchelliformis]
MVHRHPERSIGARCTVWCLRTLHPRSHKYGAQVRNPISTYGVDAQSTASQYGPNSPQRVPPTGPCFSPAEPEPGRSPRPGPGFDFGGPEPSKARAFEPGPSPENTINLGCSSGAWLPFTFSHAFPKAVIPPGYAENIKQSGIGLLSK